MPSLETHLMDIMETKPKESPKLEAHAKKVEDASLYDKDLFIGTV
jgi:hypothetical protein